MDKKFTDHLRDSLREKRDNLTAWLATTTGQEKQIRLGPAPEAAMKAHLETIDETLVKADNHTLGQCEICHESIEPSMLEMDYSCCVCLDHYSADEVRRLETELELAGKVQQSLLPSEVPQIRGLDISAYSRPAQIIGGDYFDFFTFQDHQPGLAIADVAGHGLSASLHMASVQTLLRSLVPAHVSPAEVVAEVQRLFSHNIRFTTFVTLFLAAYDEQAYTLTYSNAGHNPPLVLRQTAQEEPASRWLRPTGPAVGLVEGANFTEAQVRLHPGDLVVMYTDGLTEAMNRKHEMLGQDRIAVWLTQEVNISASEAVQVIRDGLQEFTQGEPAADDITLVVGKLKTE